MQEEILSHRALIFIDGQVYWKCKYSYINERFNWRSPRRVLKEDQSTGLLDLYMEDPTDYKEHLFSTFNITLGYYTSRQLSDDRDALKAIQGILRKFSMISGLHFFQGLPPPLARSMLFSKSTMPFSRAFGRRSDFPSYSWTGWKFNPRYLCSIEYADYITVQSKPDPIAQLDPEKSYLCGWIIWYCRFENGQTFRLSETGRLYKASPPKWEDRLKIPTSPVKELMDIPVSEENNKFYNTRTISYPLLLFWTVVINTDLRPNLQVSKYRKVTLDYKPKDRRYHIFCRGSVLMDIEIPLTLVEMSVAKFAILASDESGYWALLLKQKNGIAERQGVVLLNKDIWKNCLEPGPRWEAITLG
jgi:hypothetical protein